MSVPFIKMVLNYRRATRPRAAKAGRPRRYRVDQAFAARPLPRLPVGDTSSSLGVFFSHSGDLGLRQPAVAGVRLADVGVRERARGCKVNKLMVSRGARSPIEDMIRFRQHLQSSGIALRQEIYRVRSRIMSILHVLDRKGLQHTLELNGSESNVMIAIRDSGSDELMAVCGGACSCATCHIYVDPAFVNSFPPVSEAENELLAESPHRTAMSRLACQIPLPADFSQLSIAIAPED